MPLHFLHSSPVSFLNSSLHSKVGGQGLLNTWWGMQHICGAIDFSPLLHRESKFGNIHPCLSLYAPLICPWKSKSIYIHLLFSSLPSPSLSIPVYLIQSVRGSKFVYLPLMVLIYLDWNIPNPFVVHDFIPFISIFQGSSCGHTWLMSKGHGHSLPSFLVSHACKYKCVLNILRSTRTHTDGTISDCLWTSGRIFMTGLSHGEIEERVGAKMGRKGWERERERRR